MLKFAVLLIIASVLHTTRTLPQGAPESVCSTMLPFHGGGIAPMTSPSPFRITTSSTVVGQGQVLRVEIESNPAELNFGGFMIHARSAVPPFKVVGRFAPSVNGIVKLINCDGEESTATHTSPSPKSNLGFEWQAPTDFLGDVVFNATIAQEYDKFWVGLESIAVQVVSKDSAPPSSGISTTRKPLTSTTPSYKPAVQKVAAKTDPIYTGCGETKTCFGFPDNCVNDMSCRAITAVTVKGDSYQFELKSGYDSPAYVAVGLSTDNLMGDDSVIECVPQSGTVAIYSSWTSGTPNYGVSRDGVPQGIARLLESSYEDGTIYCKFERDNSFTVKSTTFDLINGRYFLVIASGKAVSSDHVNYHDIGRLASGTALSLSEIQSVGGKSTLLLRLHAAFMLVAWIGTASAGILIARYFKQTWVGSQICGKDQWFAWHRTLMVLTWSLTMAGFVIIFVEINGWSGERNPHAILGTVTTILCFLQPIGALFRPGPTDKSRPLFNWAHWLGGNLAHILAIVTIFFAVKLSKAELPEWFDWILVAFVAFHVVVHFVFSIAGCTSERAGSHRVNSFPMTDMTPNRGGMKERKQDAPHAGFRKLLLTVYLVIVILFVVALVVIAVLAPINEAVDTLKSKIMN